MQINSVNTFNAPSTNVQQVGNATQVNNPREQTRVAQEQKSENKDQQANQQSRFDVDQQALALVEQQQQQQKSSKQGAGANNQQTTYDQPSNQNQTAVAAYQAVDSIAQRDNIQQSFGIDLIA